MFFNMQPKSNDIFLTYEEENMLWYSLEVPHWDISNEYPQHIFLWRNKKNTDQTLLMSSTTYIFMKKQEKYYVKLS